MQRLYKFLIKAIVIWLIAYPLWLIASPACGRVLVTASNLLFHKNPFNADEITYVYLDRCIKVESMLMVKNQGEAESYPIHSRLSFDSERFHFNLTIWLALILATPFDRKWKSKLLIVFLGLIPLLVGQSLDLFLQAQDAKVTRFPALAAQHHLQGLSILDFALSWAGRYFLLIGYIVTPLLIWLPVGIRRLGVKVEPATLQPRSSMDVVAANAKNLCSHNITPDSGTK